MLYVIRGSYDDALYKSTYTLLYFTVDHMIVRYRNKAYTSLVLYHNAYLTLHLINKQGVALTGRNITRAPGGRPAYPPAGSITDDRQQMATDASEQNKTGPLGGPIISKLLMWRAAAANHKTAERRCRP